jgi:hypothetical protein
MGETVKRLILVAGVACGGLALAQERSDLMPPLPEPQPGQQIYVPGMPLPAPVAPVAAPKTAEKKERQGLDLPDDNPSFEVDMTPQTAESESTPETHLVIKGDTLWDLSSRYFRNPYQWPKLWAYNPSITNPHWIYPGDLVRLFPPGVLPSGPSAAALPPDEEHRLQGGMRLATGVFLRQTGFVEPGELAQAGKILASKEEKTMLGALDEAYVEYPKDKPLVVGQRYTIYTPTQRVNHPLTHKYLGQLVEIFGECEVRAVTDGHIAKVAIIDSLNPIERGFLVGPLKRQFKVVNARAVKGDLMGIVVATLQPRDMIGTDNVVFIDRGKDSGVELGNRFLVTRRGDGYQPVLASGPIDDRRFPRETIGEIIVVDIRDHVSTGLVTHSTRESRVGDRVETRNGY